MWRKEETLLLLTAAVMLVTGQNLVILDKTQRRLSLPSGSNLTLICGLNTTEHERYRVNFYLNSSGSSFCDSNTKDLSHKMFMRPTSTSKVEQDLENKGVHTELNHTLSDATDANNGRYYCTVTLEIPHYKCESSNWTEILFVKSHEHTTYPSLPIVTVTVRPPDGVQPLHWWLWVLLGVSAVIMIVLLLVCILLRRRCRRHREADPIYANTRPVANKQPSPRPGMPEESLKKVSSSQNLRNPSPNRRHEDRKQRYREGRGV